MSSARAYKNFVQREASRKRFEGYNTQKTERMDTESTGLLARKPKSKEEDAKKQDDVQEAMRMYFNMVRQFAKGSSDEE